MLERSSYANAFKQKKRFERAKVNSRGFHWFPAAMLEPTERLENGVSILNANFQVIPFDE